MFDTFLNTPLFLALPKVCGAVFIKKKNKFVWFLFWLKICICFKLKCEEYCYFTKYWYFEFSSLASQNLPIHPLESRCNWTLSKMVLLVWKRSWKSLRMSYWFMCGIILGMRKNNEINVSISISDKGFENRFRNFFISFRFYFSFFFSFFPGWYLCKM